MAYSLSIFKGGAVLTVIASTFFLSLPAAAAEYIHLKFDNLDIKFSVETLARYAKLGQAEQELEGYIALLPTEAQTNLRRSLNTQFSIAPQQLQHILSTPMGQMMLTEVGQIIQTSSGENGSASLQAALNSAAQDDSGLTPISLLQHLQTDVQIDLRQVFALFEQHKAARSKAHILVQGMKPLTAPSKASQIHSDRLPDLRQPGSLGNAKETVTVTYVPQNFSNGVLRKVTADLYLPDRVNSPASLIVISHGLGGNRDSHIHFAQHLVSYGFAVAVIQHPGSDKKQSQALLQGRSPHLFDVNAFIDRPSDITHLLNELEHRNQKGLKGRLNLQQVGVFGYSFGGYTALALAGAELDFAQIAQDCSTQSFLLNPSLLLQCRALELPRKAYQLHDPRVQAILIINPVNASIFGQPSLQTINIPVLWAAGTADIVTPMETEHIHSFRTLTTPHRYLGIVQGAKHGSSPMGMTKTISENADAERLVLRDYLNAVGLAFMQVHVRANQMYRSYLQPAYTQSISREPYPLNFMSFGVETSSLHKTNSSTSGKLTDGSPSNKLSRVPAKLND